MKPIMLAIWAVVAALVFSSDAGAQALSHPCYAPTNGIGCIGVSLSSPLPVTGTPSGTQDVNIVTVAGGAVPTLGTGIQGVAFAPTATAAAAIAPVVSSAAEASHVLKASPGNLYGFHASTGATAGYILVYDATSAPSNGTVTPVMCMAIPATSTMGMSPGANMPILFATGITIVFSTTGCFTQTTSATAFFSGYVK